MLDRLYQVAIAACLYRTILGLWVPVSLRRNKSTVLLIVCQDWLGNELWSATLLPPPDRNDITAIHSGGVHWYLKKNGKPGSIKTCSRTRLVSGISHQDQEIPSHPPAFRMTFVQPWSRESKCLYASGAWSSASSCDTIKEGFALPAWIRSRSCRL